MSQVKWPAFPRLASSLPGVEPRQPHADLPEGTYEREIGAEGFYGPASHMLHAHPPTGWSAIEGELRPRAFELSRLPARAQCPLDAPRVLGNAHLSLRLWQPAAAMEHLVKNADGDELLFVHAGGGELFCDFGHLRLRDGDYCLLPRATQWRLDPEPGTRLLLIEATSARYGLPDRGVVGQHAFFDPGLLQAPELDAAFEAQKSETPWQVRVKRGHQRATVSYPYNPLDAVAWQGTLMPLRINWRQLRPLMSHRVHLPPSAHTTFVSERFVVCTFCPRPLESDPGALKLPFFHSNDDYDEVLFYHRGDFISRDGIEAGMLTLHPAGLPHGPHPKALAAAQRGARTHTDEVAVMIDARDALECGEHVAAVERADYADSWRST